MTDDTNDRFGGARLYVNWPPALTQEPEYPVLAARDLDLASDAMVLKPELDDEEEIAPPVLAFG